MDFESFFGVKAEVQQRLEPQPVHSSDQLGCEEFIRQTSMEGTPCFDLSIHNMHTPCATQGSTVHCPALSDAIMNGDGEAAIEILRQLIADGLLEEDVWINAALLAMTRSSVGVCSFLATCCPADLFVSHSDALGATLVLAAAKFVDSCILRELLFHMDEDTVRILGVESGPLDAAIHHQRYEAALLLLTTMQDFLPPASLINNTLATVLKTGRKELVEAALALTHPSRLNAPDANNRTVLMLAISSPRPENSLLILPLVSDESLSVCDKTRNRSALHYAVLSSSLEVAKAVLTRMNHEQRDILDKDKKRAVDMRMKKGMKLVFQNSAKSAVG